jgi:hypothetical protein
VESVGSSRNSSRMQFLNITSGRTAASQKWSALAESAGSGADWGVRSAENRRGQSCSIVCLSLRHGVAAAQVDVAFCERG